MQVISIYIGYTRVGREFTHMSEQSSMRGAAE